MAHIPGLVATDIIPSPFEYVDVVSTTTHKTLRGPRAGVISFKKSVRSVKPNGEKVMYDIENPINQAVFPGLQGGSHNNSIAGIDTAILQNQTPEFLVYQKQCVTNTAQRLRKGLINKGYTISTGGTDVHLILVDLRPDHITGAQAECILEEISVACTKNTVPGDKSALNPSGIRLGTPALQTRGLLEDDIDKVVDFIHRGLLLSKKIGKISEPKIIDFKKGIHTNYSIVSKVKSFRDEVEELSQNFPLPGCDL